MTKFGIANTSIQKKQTTYSVLPTKYVLNANYLYIFNPSTTIEYAMPKDGKVSIKVYDILGREVAD